MPDESSPDPVVLSLQYFPPNYATYNISAICLVCVNQIGCYVT